jgi:hypothetical protein
MITEPLRIQLERDCQSLRDALGYDDFTSIQKAHAKLIIAELENFVPDIKAIERWMYLGNLGGHWIDDEDGEEDDEWFSMSEAGEAFDDMRTTMRLLSKTEKEALHSLQQEASLASTGPKSSLDH